MADITYVWTLSGWVYLAAVMDLYSRNIVGWALGNTLETSLVKEALQRALASPTNPTKNSIGVVHYGRSFTHAPGMKIHLKMQRESWSAISVRE